MEGDLPLGATPIDPDEADGLIPDHITTRGELDELEEANIHEGLAWAMSKVRARTSRDVLSESFLYDLHRRMFAAVWTWAGKGHRMAWVGLAATPSRLLAWDPVQGWRGLCGCTGDPAFRLARTPLAVP